MRRQRSAVPAWDFAAVAYDGAVFCNECCPVALEDEGVCPIFACDVVEHVLCCDRCGHKHDYMHVVAWNRPPGDA